MSRSPATHQPQKKGARKRNWPGHPGRLKPIERPPQRIPEHQATSEGEYQYNDKGRGGIVVVSIPPLAGHLD